MLANTPEMVEAHFGVPMTGGVLNTLNTRLDAEALAFMLEHGEAKVLITDTEFAPTIERGACAAARRSRSSIDVADAQGPGGEAPRRDSTTKRSSRDGDPAFAWQPPADEWDAIALNYTSGTTGNPKGVVYHHRGAYLNALSNIVDWGMPRHAVYLWTLPMFHCNGWCFPWTMAANARHQRLPAQGRGAGDLRRDPRAQGHALLRRADRALDAHQRARRDEARASRTRCRGLVAGAAPPAAMIEGMERIGFDITHVYGLTETYGPAAVCAKHAEWDALDIGARTERNGRQGVRYTVRGRHDGDGPGDDDARCRGDGETMGEIMFRGNITMKGYLKNPQATAEAFAGGWFHSGDLAVLQPDGYVEDQGPQQGHHHLRRREHQLARGRGRAVPPSGGARRGGGRAARSEVGRDAVRVRRAEARRRRSPRTS